MRPDMSSLSLLLLTTAIFCTITLVSADNELGVLNNLRAQYPDWKPRGIVDAGANVGGWTTAVQASLPGVPILMVEASTTHNKELEETKQMFPKVVDYQIAVMSSADGDTIEFFAIDAFRGTGNSMFREQSQHFNDVKPVLRTTAKLDTLVRNSHLEHVDYLKLDVQGAELLVLSGATETLNKATFVQLEVSVIEYNEGGSCWHEIDELLRQHGFHFYDTADYIRNEGAFHTKGIGQFDALYIKPSSEFMPKWLVDNKIKLCGSGRGKKTGKEQNSVREEEATMVPTKAKEQDLSHLLLSVGAAFLLGYLLGQRRIRNKELKST